MILVALAMVLCIAVKLHYRRSDKKLEQSKIELKEKMVAIKRQKKKIQMEKIEKSDGDRPYYIPCRVEVTFKSELDEIARMARDESPKFTHYGWV